MKCKNRRKPKHKIYEKVFQWFYYSLTSWKGADKIINPTPMDLSNVMKKMFTVMNLTILTKFLFNDWIAGNRYTLPTYFCKSSLVDQFSNWFQIGISPCDIRFNNTKHVNCCLVQLQKYTIIDLLQPKQLKYFTYFGSNLIYTKIVKYDSIICINFNHNFNKLEIYPRIRITNARRASPGM